MIFGMMGGRRKENRICVIEKYYCGTTKEWLDRIDNEYLTGTEVKNIAEIRFELSEME